MQNVYLVGLMGAGKTTIGRILARKLGKRFIDSDHEIEARTGASIPWIFEIEGEESFRRREAEVIRDLCAEDGVVLATGGYRWLDPVSIRDVRADWYQADLGPRQQARYICAGRLPGSYRANVSQRGGCRRDVGCYRWRGFERSDCSACTGTELSGDYRGRSARS